MTLLRRVSYGALALAFAHIVFGAIVRITGSGLGCGDHWPKCYGHWFPPFDRMDLVIEVTHRYLAFGLSVTIAGLLLLAFARRREAGVGGRGGMLRPIAVAAALVVTAALFGALVVKYELRNKYIIVVHLAIAISTLASLALAAIRGGGLGGAAATPGAASAKTFRGARVAAVLAFLAVVLGGLTAHIVGANGACVGFPHCRAVPTPGGPLHVHLTHRVIAFLLFFHLLGMVFAVRKRGESSLMQWATRIAFGTVLLQILVAAALVELYLPPVLRSLHQAVGTLVWLSIFVLMVLARRGSAAEGDGARLAPPAPRGVPEDGMIRRGAAGATAVASLAVEALAATPVVAMQAPVMETTPVAVEAVALELEPAVAVEALPEPVYEEPAPVVSYEPEVLVAMSTAEMAVPVVVVEEVAQVEEAAPVVEGVEAGSVAEVAEETADAVDPEPVVEAAAVEVEVADVADVADVTGTEAEVVAPAVIDVVEEPVVEEPMAAAAAVEDVAVEEVVAEPVVAEEVIDDEALDDEPVVVARSLDEEVAERLQEVVGRDPFEDDDAEAEALLAEAEEELDADDDFAAAIAAEFAEDEAEDVGAVVEAALVAEEAVAAEVVVETPVIPAEVAQLPAPAARRPPTLAVLIARGADF